MNRKYYVYILPAFIILFYSACSHSLQNLYDLKQQVIEYHKSGLYDQETNKVIDEAINKFSKIEVTTASAVIFDIDETALSNYEHIADHDFGYIPHLWNEWVFEANAPAIVPVLRLFKYLTDRNVSIVFLTGRPINQYEATIKNLKKAGYTAFDTLITRRENERSISAVQFKSKKRIELTEKGYNIIGSVGDQWSDLEGPNAGVTVKIPNYLYLIK